MKRDIITELWYLTRELDEDKWFENDKIKINFDSGSGYAGHLCVFLKDERQELHDILRINVIGAPDLNKTNDKILNFVYDKMNEWVCEENKKMLEQYEKKIEKEKDLEKNINNLISNF